MANHSCLRLFLLILVLGSLTSFLQKNGERETVPKKILPTFNLPEEEWCPSKQLWSKKAPSEKIQAIFLFKNKVPTDLPNVEVRYRFKLRPALLLEGKIEHLEQLMSQERSNLVTVSENQRIESVLHSIQSISPQSDSLPSALSQVFDIVGVTRLHAMGLNGTGIRIGIIDTGVNSNHSDFEGRVIAEKSFVLREFGYSADILTVDDEWGHGTAVAGIAAGKKYGIAPKAEIISAKIFEPGIRGNGDLIGEETTAAVMAAIDYCIEEGADIINLSIGQYHNLPWDLRQEWINYASINKGTIFAISAGNSGDQGIDGGTINNPGTALQSITVAAALDLHSIATFSATGPKPDYSMKPDIIAPGVGVSCPDHDNNPTQYRTMSGTSASTPIVAGVSALLLEHANNQAKQSTPGTIKAALMCGAITMEHDGNAYPAWRQGAGFLNASCSYDVLENAATEDDFDLIYVHPHKLPFEPFTTLFKGQRWSFNLTVVVSGSSNISLSLSNTTLSIEAPLHLEATDSQLIPICFHAPLSAEEGPVSAMMNISSARGASCDLEIGGTIRESIHSILLDEAHQMIVYRPEKLGAGEHYGDNNNIYGAFREWVVLMESQQIAVTPFVGGRLNSSFLECFDLFVMLNPFSYNFDPLTDWIAPQDRKYLSFSEDEVQTLREWIDTQGNLLVITRGNSTIYVPALNEFLSPYGIAVNFDDIGIIWSFDVKTPFTVNGVYSGPTLSSNPTNYIFASSSEGSLLVGHVRPSGSRVLVLGTDYCFDNYAFNGRYGLAGDQNKEFTLEIIEWVLQHSFPSDSSDSIYPFMSFLVVMAIASYVKRRRKP